MKSLTKKALMLALAIAVVCSFAVFAASDITGTSATLGEDGASVAVAYTAPATASQVTILVFKTANGGDSTDTIGTDPVINADGTTNIVYIDQKANAQSLNFSLRSTDGDGTYKVLIGGTGVAEAATAEFTKASVVEPTTFTISGTVTGAYWAGFDEDNELYKTFVELYQEDGTTEVYSYYPDSSSLDGLGQIPFALKNVEPGNYVIYVSRLGLAPMTITLNNVSGNVNLGDLILKGSDVDGSYAVEGDDVSAALALFNAGAYDAAADPNANLAIEGDDVSEILATFNAFGTYNPTIDASAQ